LTEREHVGLHSTPQFPDGVASVADLAGEGGALMRRASYASVAVASILLLSKLYAWWKTDSLAMLSSFTDSVFDVLMSVINMLAVRYALKPADDDHRFGHTSIEDIAGLAQCAFIFAAMAMIILQSLSRLASPEATLSNPELGMGVSVLGMVLTTLLVAYQTYVAARTRSLIIAADRMHYVGDILFNLGVLAAFVMSKQFGLLWADGLIAIVIALVIMWSTRSIGIRAFNNLMNREMPDAERTRIHQIVEAAEGIRGYHKLKTRYAGTRGFIQMHVDIDASLNFREAHAITDTLERALEAAFPDAEVIIHPDPHER
jgi:ferrous-iron efflux pump FieF